MSTRKRIFVLDPGELSGFAIWNGASLTTGYFPHFEQLDYRVAASDMVVLERPVGGKSTTKDIVFQVYGACRERVYTLKKDIVIQEPSVPKTVFLQYNLSRQLKGMKTQHPKDAFMHLLFWLGKNQPEDVEKVLRLGKGKNYDSQ